MLYLCTRTIRHMKQKLTEKEERLMNIFWAHGSMFIRDLMAYIPDPKPHYNTVATVVARYYNNSYLSLVSQFVEEDKMDIRQLKDLIAKIEKK